ncbi:MAG: alcohol dehydrogenase family protein [Rhodobacteraceae bacterium]|nr:alcohol dehydrogenase family protein [Paracoccaceae bacterium]
MASIPKTMRAFVLTGHGGMDKLVYHHDWPVPVPKHGEILLKVKACGLNNTDVNTRTAWYSSSVTEATSGADLQQADDKDAAWGGAAIEFPRIQGADIVGVVAEVGDDADAAMIGKRALVDPWLRDWSDPYNRERCKYLGSECDGGFAEFVCLDRRQVHPIESELSHAELATFATSWVTAENMLNRGQVYAEDVALVSGASGGVGSALIRLANRRGATTVALASSAKHRQVRKLGADAVLSRAPADLPGELRKAIGRDTVTAALDVVGGEYWSTMIDALARGGRYVCSGAIAGPMVELDLRKLYLRDLTFCGATVTAPHTFRDLVGYIAGKEIRPVLAAEYPLESLREAQQAFIDKRHTGNIVVAINS